MSISDATSIAIISMAGRFPGARSVDQLWKNVRAGVESVRFFTDEELLAAGVPAELLGDPAYVKACPQLEGIDQFDAPFFGLSPRDAAVFDPQHRFFLECAWEAFEDAGYVGSAIEGPVGVFATCGMSAYMIENLMTNPQVMSSVGEWLVRHTGNDVNFLATRVSYQLDLRGPSLNVQTACSSSLVAIHLACQSLLNGECDLALAGGSTISPEQNKGYLFKEGEILSPDGHCRAFDAKSHGTTTSSATGCVLLKRLADAIADGDRILAIVRGSAINNDGAEKVGYLAPSVVGQARVVAEALALSGVNAEDISYVEAHGTGTLLGDPIEIAGITQAYRATTDKKQFCAIGSLKSNFGHAGEAAGIASFIKTVLALVHREIPPSLHYETPNPQADFENSPFYVAAELQDWKSPPGKPRRAGITGLGAGGTNAHLILEEAPSNAPSPSPARAEQLLVLSAKSGTALEVATTNLAAHLRAHRDVHLADAAFTLQLGRTAFRHRRAIVAADVASAIAALEDGKRAATGGARHGAPAPGVVFMFPGGGAQYARMGYDLYEREPVYRRAFDQCLAILSRTQGLDLKPLVFSDVAGLDAATRALERPSRALPALFSTSYALAKLLESWGIVPSALIGHSAGEYVAACLASVITLEEGLALVSVRGRLFEKLPPGAMLSVPLPESELAAVMDASLSFAAINAPSLSVASGPVASIEALEVALRARDVDCTRIHIDVAAHSSMLEPILAEFGAFCRTVRFQAPKLPIVSNLTGRTLEASEATDPKYWVEHLRRTVRFADGLATLLDGPDGEHRVFVEVGPGRTLSSVARMQSKAPLATTSSVRHPKEDASDVAFLLGAVGRMWIAGVDVDFARLHEGTTAEPRRRIPLPTYPWERQRHWIAPGKSLGAIASTKLGKRADVAEWFSVPGFRRAPLSPPIEALATKAHARRWLILADDAGLAPLLVAELGRVAAQDDVVLVRPGAHFERAADGSYAIDPALRGDYDLLIDDLRTRALLPTHVVHLWAVTKPAGTWAKLVATARGKTPPIHDMQTLAFASLVFLAQAVGREGDPLQITVAANGLFSILGESELQPEKALLLGPTKVLPREFPHVGCKALDLVLESSSDALARSAHHLAREAVHTAEGEDVIAHRGEARFVQRFDATRLEAVERPAAWAQRRGTYLITGGLGGIALSIAEHLARHAKCNLVLVGRTPLPPKESWAAHLATHAEDDATSGRIRKVQALEASSSDVLVIGADVSDRAAMERAIEVAREKFGRIHGVIHTAGVLEDQLVALRSSDPGSRVIDAKVRGALVLDELFEGHPLDVFVLCSSVSSILGLPGQVDYTAANAFLDAFAHARTARGAGLTVSVDWNAWQEVGMAVAASREARPTFRGVAGNHPALEQVIDEGEGAHFVTAFSRARHWLLSEHVVRDADAVIPGTGFLELARAAIEHRPEARAVELRDVYFLAPFAVAEGASRDLHVRVRGEEITMWGESPDSPHVTARGRYVDAESPSKRDLSAIAARCTVQDETFDGFSKQSFVAFGPRWGSLRRVQLGVGEALLTLEMPAQHVAELAQWRLHPALLDVATGGAQALVPGFDPQSTFYVPFSYERVLLRRALPAKLFSHVRLRSDAKDVAVFDVTLLDEDGEEVAVLEGFTMRRVTHAAVMTAEPKPRRRPATPIDEALREGIFPREGVDALDRVLASGLGPQVVTSSVDLAVWRAQVDAQARPAVVQGLDDGGDEGAGAHGDVSSTFEAPRDDVERTLAAMWRELLGVRRVGIHDDFFDLGGQSLIAVRLFTKIRKQWSVELPLSTLFEAPTIGQCAALVRESIGPSPEQTQRAPHAEPVRAPEPRGFRSLVAIQRGGDRTPFFCVHGAGGNVLNLRDLSRGMDRAQPFYGLQARGIDGIARPHESIEEMAASYLDEVRALQPHGPYLLGGYSGGGVVAYEMAQRLVALGERVDLLAFLDTFSPMMQVRQVTMDMRLQRLFEEGTRYLREAFRNQIGRVRYLARVHRLEQLLARGAQIPDDLRDLHLTMCFERVAARYRPAPYPGRAILFKAETAAYVFAGGGPHYGWEAVMPDRIEVVSVPGNHDTLLLEPNASVLLRSLRRHLDELHRAGIGKA